MQSHHISFMTDRQWVQHSDFLPDNDNLVMSHSLHDQQAVSDSGITFCQAAWSHLISWPTASKWQCSDPMSGILITVHPASEDIWRFSSIFSQQPHFLTASEYCYSCLSSRLLSSVIGSVLTHVPSIILSHEFYGHLQIVRYLSFTIDDFLIYLL